MGFKKGQSGNPSGRPKEDREVKELARKHTRAAIARLVFWMESENAKASVSACTALLDRGHGKPAQTLLGDNDSPLVINVRRYADDQPAE